MNTNQIALDATSSPHGGQPLPAPDAATRSPTERNASADSDETAELLVRFFRALGDPTRIRLLQLLTEAPAGERSGGELVAAVDAPQSRVSTHLGCLRWCGLVQIRRKGNRSTTAWPIHVCANCWRWGAPCCTTTRSRSPAAA